MRLAAFALILAAAFGAAAAFGRAVGPIEREVAEADHAEEAGAASLPGLAVAQDGFRLVAERTRFHAGRAQVFVFRIEGARAFDVSHERRMHLIVVRRDLAGFQHLHPVRRADGVWAVRLRLPAGGVYRAFADFVVDGRKLTLGVDLFAAGPAHPLPAADPGVPVTLDRDGGRLEFSAGAPVGRYLGARGHLVVLRAGDLAYLHTHAEEDELAFETEFPSAGTYRLFLQFRSGGAVRTAEFTVRG
jgi:hypothetical protein